MQEAILKIEGLSKQFQLHDQNKLIPSYAQVQLEVFAGELTALIGPTGAGKSSVLKAIYRTYLPSSGRILYRDANGAITDLAQASEHRMLELRKQDLGFVTQFLHCLPRKSAVEVVAEPLVQRAFTQSSGLPISVASIRPSPLGSAGAAGQPARSCCRARARTAGPAQRAGTLVGGTTRHLLGRRETARQPGTRADRPASAAVA